MTSPPTHRDHGDIPQLSPLEARGIEQRHDWDHPEAQEQSTTEEDGKTDDDHSSHELVQKHQTTVFKLGGGGAGATYHLGCWLTDTTVAMATYHLHQFPSEKLLTKACVLINLHHQTSLVKEAHTEQPPEPTGGAQNGLVHATSQNRYTTQHLM